MRTEEEITAKLNEWDIEKPFFYGFLTDKDKRHRAKILKGYCNSTGGFETDEEVKAWYRNELAHYRNLFQGTYAVWEKGRYLNVIKVLTWLLRENQPLEAI